MKISANGVSTQYELEGPAGAPVVTFSHSLAANLHLWDAQAAALRDRYRILRYDIRGHGGPRFLHCSCVEAAADFNRALLEFLRRVA